MSDHGCNLFSLDLRNGRIVYGYKGGRISPKSSYKLSKAFSTIQGLSGAVTSMAPSPTLLGSTALDRFCRIHSTFPSSPLGGQQQAKGEVLDKVFVKSIPTVIVWDQNVTVQSIDEDIDEDNVWDELEDVGDASDDETSRRKKRRDSKK